jgi:anaerobic glycerol-3-phosphate dehydrogenase
MTVTLSEVRQLRDGAKTAHNVNIHRLAHLLDALADLGQMIIDGCDRDAEMTIPDVIEKGARVARDITRPLPPTTDTDDQDPVE